MLTMAIAPQQPITWDDVRSKPAANVFEVTFTPEQCRRIVKASQGENTNFRSLAGSDSRMQADVIAMRTGKWVWTDADPVRLHVHEKTGELVCSDGQHRLWAASVARRSLRTLVLFGPDWNAGLHVDRNRSRSAAQYLAHEYGLKGGAPYVALARYHLSRIYSFHTKLAPNGSRQMIDDETLIEFVVKYLDDIQWCLHRASIGSARGFHQTAYGTFLYEVRAIDHASASQFHDDMKDPDLEMLDPLAQLRKSVMAAMGRSGLRMHRDATMANLVKAWNQRQSGQTLTMWKNAQSDDYHFPAGYKPPSMMDAFGREARPGD